MSIRSLRVRLLDSYFLKIKPANNLNMDKIRNLIQMNKLKNKWIWNKILMNDTIIG